VSNYNTKNYTEQGGERTVIGGELDIVGGGQILRDGEPIDFNVGSVAWDDIQGKPSTFPPSSHNHNDLYYTKAEVDNLIQQLRDELGGGDGS